MARRGCMGCWFAGTSGRGGNVLLAGHRLLMVWPEGKWMWDIWTVEEPPRAGLLPAVQERRGDGCGEAQLDRLPRPGFFCRVRAAGNSLPAALDPGYGIYMGRESVVDPVVTR